MKEQPVYAQRKKLPCMVRGADRDLYPDTDWLKEMLREHTLQYALYS